MISNSSNLIKYFEAILLRLMIFAFIHLTLEFSRVFISASAGMHPYMAIWGDIFFEATVIIIFNLLYGMESIGHDTNTLNFYALICHLIFVVFYFYGYQVAEYHNNAIKFLNALIVLRLFYFGSREFLSKIAIIEHSKKWLLDSRLFVNTYVNGLTIALFFLCAIPLFTLIYIINTDQMRVTGIAIILFTFFIAIEKSDKTRDAEIAKRTVLPLDDISDAHADQATQAHERVIAQVATIANTVDKANFKFFDIEFFKDICKMLAIILVGVLIVCALLLQAKNRSIFNYGYAAGYTDAKSGDKPKMETNWNLLQQCYDSDKFRMSDPSCEKVWQSQEESK